MGEEMTQLSAEDMRELARGYIAKARNTLMVEIAYGLRNGLTLEEILDLLGLQGNAMAKGMIRATTRNVTPEELAAAIDEARRSWA